jgi:hypothetical protein
MSTTIETIDFDALVDEMRHLKEKLNDLRRQVVYFLSQESDRESLHHVSLIRETFNIQTVLRSLHDDLIRHQSIDSSTVSSSFHSKKGK